MDGYTGLVLNAWSWNNLLIRLRRFLRRHPAEMGAAEVTAFLNWLATDRNVAAATQNQTLAEPRHEFLRPLVAPPQGQAGFHASITVALRVDLQASR